MNYIILSPFVKGKRAFCGDAGETTPFYKGDAYDWAFCGDAGETLAMNAKQNQSL